MGMCMIKIQNTCICQTGLRRGNIYVETCVHVWLNNQVRMPVVKCCLHNSTGVGQLNRITSICIDGALASQHHAFFVALKLICEVRRHMQVLKRRIQLDGSLISMSLWTMGIAGQFDHPLFRALMLALSHFHSSELDAAAMQRIHFVRLLSS